MGGWSPDADDEYRTYDRGAAWSADPLIRWAADPLIRWSAEPPIRWSADPLIRWSDDGWAAGWWSADPLIRWWLGSRIRWSADPTDPLIRWSAGQIRRSADPTDPLIRWSAGPAGSDDPLIRWSDDPLMADPLIRWSDDPLIRWSADPLIRWSADPLIRWSADPLIRCWCLQWQRSLLSGWDATKGQSHPEAPPDLGGQVKAHDAETDFYKSRADLQGNKILALVERNLFLGSHGAVTAQPLLPSLLV